MKPNNEDHFDEDDLPTIPQLESDEEVKLEPDESIGERVKLNLQKKKKQEQD